jgi:hypothetical protein
MQLTGVRLHIGNSGISDSLEMTTQKTKAAPMRGFFVLTRI